MPSRKKSSYVPLSPIGPSSLRPRTRLPDFARKQNLQRPARPSEGQLKYIRQAYRAGRSDKSITRSLRLSRIHERTGGPRLSGRKVSAAIHKLPRADHRYHEYGRGLTPLEKVAVSQFYQNNYTASQIRRILATSTIKRETGSTTVPRTKRIALNVRSYKAPARKMRREFRQRIIKKYGRMPSARNRLWGMLWHLTHIEKWATRLEREGYTVGNRMTA